MKFIAQMRHQRHRWLHGRLSAEQVRQVPGRDGQRIQSGESPRFTLLNGQHGSMNQNDENKKIQFNICCVLN